MSDIAEFVKMVAAEGPEELTPIQKRVVEIFDAGETLAWIGPRRE